MGDPTFGETLRQLRLAAGLSLRDLARLTLSSKSHLHDFETGRGRPSIATAARLDEALRAGGALAELAPTASGLALTPAQLPGTAGRPVDAGTVSAAIARTARLHRLDDYLGGRETYALFAEEFGAVTTWLAHADHDARIERDLVALAAEQAQLIAWAAFDAGDDAEGRRRCEQGRELAVRAGDGALTANALSLLGYHSSDRGAIRLLEAAHLAGPMVSLRARALFAGRLAWGYARCGDTRAADGALQEAETAIYRFVDGEEPDWLYWFDSMEVRVIAGRCWLAAGRPGWAVTSLETALLEYSDARAREKARYLSYLATAYGVLGEVEHACTLLNRAMDLAWTVGSVRPRQAVLAAAARLRTMASRPAVHDTIERARGWPAPLAIAASGDTGSGGDLVSGAADRLGAVAADRSG